ncbi:hypothetical protein [Candidatus Accumulibacter contiguus]|uniref:hypothetical protein n=1 Tax=Candidatus Accumulibacter contiguus TaxID=2954381 RepID=UPI00207BA16C|nr:hypothetical protein [Candidatus Accumulibacter contiguus]
MSPATNLSPVDWCAAALVAASRINSSIFSLVLLLHPLRLRGASLITWNHDSKESGSLDRRLRKSGKPEIACHTDTLPVIAGDSTS